MNVRRIRARGLWTLASLGLCLFLLGALGGCGSTTTEIVFVPGEVLAQFALYQSTTETAAGPVSSFQAGAIFYKGLITLTVDGGLVEVVDPVGTAYPMAVRRNPAGAPYYLTTLPSLALSSSYAFRVTLASGAVLETPITTPAQSLAVTSPALGETLALNDYLRVGWTGTGPRNVAIVLRREGAAEIFSVVGLGPVQAPDTGSFDGSTRPTPVIVANARAAGDAGTGTRYLTVTRNNSVSAGGYFAGSFAQASLIYARQVEIVP